MKKIKLISIIFFCFLCLNQVHAQKKKIKLFDPLIGHQWKGHYMNSEDSALVHFISWEYGLDSTYVKQIKHVPEVVFKMETYFYWDYELNQISSITFLNKAMVAKGFVEFKENKINHHYKTYFSKGANQSQQTFELNERGELEDFFYRNRSNMWTQGHFILYK